MEIMKEIKINHPIRTNGSQGDPTSNGTSRPDTNFQHRVSEKESELLEKINKQILSLKDEIEKEEKTSEVTAIDQ